MRSVNRGFTLGMLGFRPVIALKSEIFNTLQSVMTALGTGLVNITSEEEKRYLPSPADNFKAHLIFMKDLQKVRRLALDLQLIESTERDFIDNITVNPTAKNLVTEQMGHFGNRMTDYKARMIGMVSWMLMEGSYDAYSYDNKSGKITYNEIKDLRFYTKDGIKKTEHGEYAILQHIKNNLVKEGVNKPMGHDFTLSNKTLKWYADKYIVGGFTEIDKPLASMTWLGSMISVFRMFSFPRLFNMGLFAKTRQVEYVIRQYRMIQENGLHRKIC